jgi:hypothetical protein
MRRARLFLPLILLSVVCSGCYVWNAPVQPPRGLFLTQYAAPVTTEFQETPVGGKRGQAVSHYINPLIFPDIAWGDASIQTAALDAGIKEVHYVDYELLDVLGIYAKMTINVYGE